MDTLQRITSLFGSKPSTFSEQSHSILLCMPTDMLVVTISYLEEEYVWNLILTCKKMRNFIMSNSLIWKQLCEKKYLLPDFKSNTNWLDLCFTKDRLYSNRAKLVNNLSHQAFQFAPVNSLAKKITNETQFKSVGMLANFGIL
jgi:hypothetical protein